ncbi:MAG: gamma-glutamyl-gamma-aminobutyrate hydrolase family protein [Propionibacterium sp.]|nr:gamma-glutamyl-gamma-aminobutyrate hydrolase family protein [Actinomyces sp.]MDN6794061.1 gamma-glutamyl-gamma-aminobutyrate hydrolase family protein [Propionibacterium sp.]
MTSDAATRPRLFVSNVVRQRPGAPAFHHLVTLLSSHLVQVASRDWEVTWAFAQDEGVRATLARARAADAVVLMGGEDISPDLYGVSTGYPGESPHHRGGDLAQIELVRDAVRRSTPLLGICRGLQVLNVALGGTLVPDLTVPGHRSDTLLQDLRFARHEVVVDPARRLAPALVGGEVHSAHHQGVDRLGESLLLTAAAPDGTVEAVEHTSAPVYGVQWHPEDPASDPRSLGALLDHLRSATRERIAA